MRSKVEEILEKLIRPGLRMDGGEIEVVDVEESTGMVKVRMLGSCVGCPVSTMTLQMGVERALMEGVPGFKRLIAV